MNKKTEFNQNSTPNLNSTPNSSSDNSQLQWVMQTISELKTSNAKSQEDLVKLLSDLHNKIEATHTSVSEKIVENNKLFEEKIELRHSLLEVRIKGVSDGIESKHALACEIMKSIEPNVINKINNDQKSFNRWIVGLLVGVFLTVGGILIRVLMK